MEQAIILKYGEAGYFSAKREAHTILSKLGDLKSDEELFSPGFLLIKTVLKPREVVENARELFLSDPQVFNSTILWVPVDYLCSIDEIPEIIKEDIAPLISDDEYALDIIGRADLLDKIVPLIKGKPSYSAQKILRVQISNNSAAISFLKPNDIFRISE